MPTSSLARSIVRVILSEINGRSGGDHFLDSMTPDVKWEFKQALIEIVQDELDKAE